MMKSTQHIRGAAEAHGSVLRYLHKEGTREQLDATRGMIELTPSGKLDKATVNAALADMHERMRSYGYEDYIGNDVSYVAEAGVAPVVDPALPEAKFREAALGRLTLMRYSLHIERKDELIASDYLDETMRQMQEKRRHKAKRYS